MVAKRPRRKRSPKKPAPLRPITITVAGVTYKPPPPLTPPRLRSFLY